MTRRQCHCLWRLSVIAIGVLFIASGVYLYLNWIEMFTKMRGKEMALSPTSPAFSGWKVSPLPLNFDVYLFNWTNPDDFQVGSPRKPHFEQLGPYRFREAPDKVDIEWHNDNSSLSFRKKAFFYFDEENSKGRLTDRITSVNTVAHSVALRMKDIEGFSKSLVQSMFKLYSQAPSITKSAEEWMFKGFAHQFVTMGNFFSKFSSDIEVPYDRVGYLYTRNGSSTYDGHFNMFTGADDIRKMGQIYSWNGQTHNGVYEGTCGDVKGSMGEFFPPNLSTNDTVYIYLPNLCRAVPLDYTETVTVHGVTAFKFSGGERSVDNGTLYPEERCFCVGGKCEPSGVINIAPCKFNSSIYMSYPHFYKADPSYLAAVDGLQPDKDKHEFFMTLEPNAGVPMDVGGGFQANYLMEPVKGFGKFENIPRVFMPLMWAEERVRVTPEIAAEIALVPLIVLLGQTFIGILLAAGVILICWYPTKAVTQLCTTDDPKAKVTLFNPYSINLAGLTHQQQQQVLPRVNLAHWRKESSADVPLLEYRNGAFVPVINRSNPNAEPLTDSLLNDTLCVPTNVITR